jgi:hypothetical protein
LRPAWPTTEGWKGGEPSNDAFDIHWGSPCLLFQISIGRNEELSLLNRIAPAAEDFEYRLPNRRNLLAFRVMLLQKRACATRSRRPAGDRPRPLSPAKEWMS